MIEEKAHLEDMIMTFKIQHLFIIGGWWWNFSARYNIYNSVMRRPLGIRFSRNQKIGAVGIILVRVLLVEIVEIGFCASVCQDSNQIFQESGMVEIFWGCRWISPMSRLLEFNQDLPFLVTSYCIAGNGRVLLVCIHFLMSDGWAKCRLDGDLLH